MIIGESKTMIQLGVMIIGESKTMTQLKVGRLMVIGESMKNGP